jgi:hypothetical protein
MVGDADDRDEFVANERLRCRGAALYFFNAS